MGDDRHRHTRRRQVLHDLENLADQLRVESGGRLVKQHDLRIHRERTRDSHALLLTTREFGGVVVRAISQADAIQQFESLGACLALRTLQDLNGCLHDVFQRGLVGEEIEALEHHADPRTLSSDLLIVALEERAARILAIAQQLTVDVHAAGANVLEHVQAAQERRLARTRGAKDDADLA